MCSLPECHDLRESQRHGRGLPRGGDSWVHRWAGASQAEWRAVLSSGISLNLGASVTDPEEE